MDDPKRPANWPQSPPKPSYRSAIQQQRKDNSVSKFTQSVTKRIGGALRAENARNQARRDNKPR